MAAILDNLVCAFALSASRDIEDAQYAHIKADKRRKCIVDVTVNSNIQFLTRVTSAHIHCLANFGFFFPSFSFIFHQKLLLMVVSYSRCPHSRCKLLMNRGKELKNNIASSVCVCKCACAIIQCDVSFIIRRRKFAFRSASLVSIILLFTAALLFTALMYACGRADC